MTIRVDSEIGRLRRVLVHRPGLEIDRMVPALMEELLFDDILYGDGARAEHDGFCDILQRANVEILDPQLLLAEVLENESPRRRAMGELQKHYDVSSDICRQLERLDAATLAATLVAGRRSDDPRKRPSQKDFFALPPVPNYFFQRDPQIVLGDRVFISSMATEARLREPLLARLVFDHHPALEERRDLIQIGEAEREACAEDPSFPMPTLEGGDVLIASETTLLVGLSERTGRRGVEALAEYLRREETQFDQLILVELPKRRSFMHLDTVFTLIDEGLCLAHLPVIEPGRAESVHVYRVDLDAPELAFALRPSLLGALEEVGIDLEVVPCGGPDDRIDQDREQWTDGANAFAIAPGVILIYRRNRGTVAALADRGWRVVTEEDVLERGVSLLGEGPTVVAILGNELSRARGGPRCMTMPLERDPLGAAVGRRS